MDLIYTDAKRIDKGVLLAYSFDLSFGADENDFEISLGASEPALDFGAFVYIEGTEYGGIVDSRKTVSDENTITYGGRTWHGMLNSKVIEPDAGEDYLTVSGEANAVLAALIARLGLTGLFAAPEKQSGISIAAYQFHRYCKGYDGIRAMLAAAGAKLNIAWQNRAVRLCAVPVTDYTAFPVDGDVARLSVRQFGQKVNHLVCLGKGELAEREVIHLYADGFGRIGDTKYYSGLDEVAEVYDNTSTEELRSDGIKKLEELRNSDTAQISIPAASSLTYDIGDIVGASDIYSGVSVAAAVEQKIVKINNGVIKIEYKAGG